MNNMKSLKNWMLISIAATMMMSLLTSCAEHDNPSSNIFLSDVILGMWCSEQEIQGTIGEGDNTQEYCKVVHVVEFQNETRGIWAKYYIDKNDEVILQEDGYNLGTFTYTTALDSIITINTTSSIHNVSETSQWLMKYTNGHITEKNVQEGYNLTPATYEQLDRIKHWGQSVGLGASAVTYNINDEDFTPTTWRDQEAIYIWDGSTNITGQNLKNPDVYTLVNMPWYKGDVQTNLPEGFCDDITPENGWEWVLNRCGSTNTPNNNFFALYNKYTGTLRFFYYMPYEFSTGNDHVWQVSMTDHLAQQSVWKYGLLPDKTISNKNVIGQTYDNTYVTYVTPWTNYMSDDGLITPNAGWWAFDVDLSQTRNDDLSPNDNLRLQMRSWNVQHASLNSTLAAALKGSYKGNLDADVDLLKSQHVGNSAKGVVFKLANMSGDIVSIVTKVMSKKYTELFGPAINLAKTGCNLAGVKTNGSEDIEGSIKGKVEGTITLNMDGTIDTEGTIRGSAPTVGVPSPTIFLKDFDTENSHLGQGVWNLKRAPVVYVSERYFYAYPTYMIPCFYDPNSIEIELNPDIFPPSEIEYILVESICSGSKSILDNNETRRAYGLNTSYTPNFSQTSVDSQPWGKSRDWDLLSKIRPYDPYWDGALHDFLYASKDKMGFEHTKEFPLLGRQTNDFWLEPVHNSDDAKRVASHEVNVIVQVKLKTIDAPIVYVRSYLPEYKKYDYEELKKSVKRFTESYKHSNLYDYQMQRIADICAIYSMRYKKPYTVTKATEGNYGNASADNLFNSDYNDPWYVRTSDKQNGIWYVEFYRNDRTITPKTYSMSVRGNNLEYPGRCPKSWKLMAKLNESDKWTILFETVDNNSLKERLNYATQSYNLNVTDREWKYFRLEVSENWGDDIMQIGELNFYE